MGLHCIGHIPCPAATHLNQRAKSLAECTLQGLYSPLPRYILFARAFKVSKTRLLIKLALLTIKTLEEGSIRLSHPPSTRYGRGCFSFLLSCFTVVYAHHHNILSSGTDRAHPRWNHRVFCAKATTKTAHYWLWFDANICTKYVFRAYANQTREGPVPERLNARSEATTEIMIHDRGP